MCNNFVIMYKNTSDMPFLRFKKHFNKKTQKPIAN